MQVQVPVTRKISIALPNTKYEVEVHSEETLKSAKRKLKSRHQISKQSKIVFWMVNNKLSASPTLPVTCFPHLQHEFLVTVIDRNEYYSNFKKVYVRQGDQQYKIVVPTSSTLKTVDELYKIITNKQLDARKFQEQAKSTKIAYFNEDSPNFLEQLDLNTKMTAFRNREIILQAFVNRVKFRLKKLANNSEGNSEVQQSKFYFNEEVIGLHASEIASKIFNSTAHHVVFMVDEQPKHFTQRLGDRGMEINPRKCVIELAEVDVDDPVQVYLAHAQKQEIEFPKIVVPIKELLGCTTEQIMQLYQSHTGVRQEDYKSMTCYPVQNDERVAELWPKDRVYGKFSKLAIRISSKQCTNITSQTHESDIINNFLKQIKPITQQGDQTLKKQRINALIRDYETRLKEFNASHRSQITTK